MATQTLILTPALDKLGPVWNTLQRTTGVKGRVVRAVIQGEGLQPDA